MMHTLEKGYFCLESLHTVYLITILFHFVLRVVIVKAIKSVTNKHL